MRGDGWLGHVGRWAAAAAVAVGALALPGSALGADPPAYRDGDYADGQAQYVLPPGQNGLVTALDLPGALGGGERPANSDDQLPLYQGLIHATGSLTDDRLGQFFEDGSFGVRPEDVVRTERPADGVVIVRDRAGVPHVRGDTNDAMAFGAGYAQAEDRLFLMDVLRHYGRGDLASFLGSSCEFEQMDHDQLLLAPYTPERATAQVDALPAQYGQDGALAQAMIASYVRGINAYVTRTSLDPSALPADYLAALQPPQPWTPADVVSIAGLIGGIFGKGGGEELANARLLQHLEATLGVDRGRRAFTELKRREDPSAPTTTQRRFPYDEPGTVDSAKTALPDDASRPLTGTPIATTPGCAGTQANPTALRIIDALKAMPEHMSNAIVVNADQTRAGHPIAVFGPQVSYFAPQILSVIDLRSPDYAAMGASFPGTGLVELGRGPDFAWSATSAGTDVIDQRLERICSPSGGTPDPEGKSYLYEGECRAMVHETYTTSSAPKPGGAGAPTTIRRDIYRTVHGVVQGWTTAEGGKPVAVVNERSTYEHDVDSVVGFLRWGQPELTHDVASWKRGAQDIGYTFNWFYVDDRHTGYYASGRDPVRPDDVDPDLPTWGTGESEWQGLLPPEQHPQDSDPAAGHLISWNNKPAPGFAAADDQYGYGQVFRSQLLEQQLAAQQRAHPEGLTRAEVVTAMAEAATQDLDGVQVLPPLLDVVGSRPQPAGVQQMLAVLRTWAADGAHRRTAKQGDAQYDHAAAVATMDELEVRLIRALFDPLLLSGGLGSVGSSGGAATSGYSALPMQFVNTPNSGGAHLGSAYDGGYEGYVRTLLQQLLGQAPADALSPTVTDALCGAQGLGSCPAAIDGALAATYSAMVAANGGSTDPATWTASPESAAAGESMVAHDAIHFRALGIVGQPAIEWQNRPTYQQVVQFPRGRDDAGGTGAGATGGGGTPTATTGPAAPAATPAPGAPASARPSGGGVSIGTGSTPDRCRSRRQVRITLPRGLRHARVVVRGKRVRVTTRRGRRTALIDLRERARGTVRVRITGRSASGRRVVRTRAFRPCTARRR